MLFRLFVRQHFIFTLFGKLWQIMATISDELFINVKFINIKMKNINPNCMTLHILIRLFTFKINNMGTYNVSRKKKSIKVFQNLDSKMIDSRHTFAFWRWTYPIILHLFGDLRIFRRSIIPNYAFLIIHLQKTSSIRYTLKKFHLYKSYETL